MRAADARVARQAHADRAVTPGRMSVPCLRVGVVIHDAGKVALCGRARYSSRFQSSTFAFSISGVNPAYQA